MIAFDEDALMCDLAQTYQIYDYRQLSPKMVAAFSVGLEDKSRIKMKLSGLKVPMDTLLLAQITDAINTLVWMNSKDCRNNSKRPKSLVEAILKPERDDKPKSFASGADFERYRRELLRKGGHLT